MLGKLTDVLREVFWLKKKSARKKPAVRRKIRKTSTKTKNKPAKGKPALDPRLARAGEITHYFDRIKVAVVKVTGGTILVGDRLTIAGRGKRRPFVQKVWSMQIESKDVKIAKKGQLIGIKIDKPVAPGDIVYK